MQIVAGVTRDEQGLDALALGGAMAEALGAGLIVANVLPRGYDFPGAAHIDAEWRGFLIQQAQDTLDWARAEVGGRERVEYRIGYHNSSGIGLNELAVESGSPAIVIGSAPGASSGRIGLGSTADQLLHGSPAAVAIAPMGYSDWAPARLNRAIVAYQGSKQANHALDVVVQALSRSETPTNPQVALVGVVQQMTKLYGSRLGRNAEDPVMEALAEQAAASLESARRRVPARHGPVATAVLMARDVTQALARFDWRDDDLLVVGSAKRGPLRRVLLGDMSYRLIRATTVPVCVVPRSPES